MFIVKHTRSLGNHGQCQSPTRAKQSWSMLVSMSMSGKIVANVRSTVMVEQMSKKSKVCRKEDSRGREEKGCVKGEGLKSGDGRADQRESRLQSEGGEEVPEEGRLSRAGSRNGDCRRMRRNEQHTPFAHCIKPDTGKDLLPQSDHLRLPGLPMPARRARTTRCSTFSFKEKGGPRAGNLTFCNQETRTGHPTSILKPSFNPPPPT
jgi:hypothetical protein